MNDAPPIAVYVHWPYCSRVCPYCDFNVLRDRSQAEQPDLARAILSDLEGQAALVGPRQLSSIFLGGGTPSLMNPEWAAGIIDKARALWPGGENAEITLEANPTDAEADRFAAFAEAGVNRLSLGVQSLRDEALQFLGRNHTAEEARRAAAVALDTFDRLSIDMIYARPGQTAGDWREELGEAVALGAEHISPYQLTIEPKTAFGMAKARGELVPADEDATADLYELTQEILQSSGYAAYEVSNHAKNPFAQSRHNLAYWRGWDYVGAGPGAHGRLTTADGRLAFECETRVPDYIAAVEKNGTGFADSEVLTPRQVAYERVLLGLRSNEGVPLEELAFLDLDQGRMEQHVVRGLLVLAGGRIIATPEGRAVLDRLTADLIR